MAKTKKRRVPDLPDVTVVRPDLSELLQSDVLDLRGRELGAGGELVAADVEVGIICHRCVEARCSAGGCLSGYD